MKQAVLAILVATSLSLSAHAQVMGRLPGVLFPSDRGTRTSSNLQAQVTAVSTIPYTFVLDRGTWTVTEDLSFPATIRLQLLPGAVLDVAAGVNLEILGELDAPDAVIFTGTGTASGPAIFPYRHVAWGATNLFDIGIGYLASYSAFTNEQATTDAEIAAIEADIVDITNNLSAVGGVLIVATNDIGDLNSNFSALNADVGTINTNFATVSNAFTIVSGVVNTNASILATNAVAHNYNFTTVLPDLFDDVFAGVSGWDRAAFTNSLQRASTNASYVIPGSLGSYLSLTNWYYSSFENIIQPWATNVNQVWGGVDIGKLNEDFGAISEDFLSVSNYLLNASDGVVTTLQENQNTTVTNFLNVNVNTKATTNLFNIVGQLLGKSSDTNYTTWVNGFLQMNTGYSALPTNLSLSFPNLFTNYTADVLEPAVSNAVDFHAFTCLATNLSVVQPVGGTYYALGGAGYEWDVQAAAGDSFEATNGIFTVPYAGWYMFGVQLRGTTASNTASIWMGVVKDEETAGGGDYWESFWTKPGGGYAASEHHLSASTLVELEAGDRMQAYLYRAASGGSATYTVLRFFGYLVQKTE